MTSPRGVFQWLLVGSFVFGIGCTPAAPGPTAAPTKPPAAPPAPAAPAASPATAASPAAAPGKPASPVAEPAAKPSPSPAAQAPAKADGPTVNFKFRTPFVPALSYSPFYVAQEMFWPDLAMNAEVLPGTPPLPVQTLSAGTEQMGYAGVAAILPAIAQGAPITIIAVIERRDPTGITFITESGIRTLKDVEGRTVGSYAGSHNVPLIRVAMKRAGVDDSKVNFANVTPGGEVALMMEKRIDAQAGFAGSQDVRIRCQGTPASAIPISDAGVDLYGQAIIANTNWIREVGDQAVSRALLGLIRGAKVVKTDPTRAVDVVAKHRPQQPLDPVMELSTVSSTGFIRRAWDTGTDTLKQGGFGWIDAAEMERTQNLLLEAGLIPAKVDPAKVYTTKYLEDPQVKAAAMDWVQTPWAPLPAAVRERCGLE